MSRNRTRPVTNQDVTCAAEYMLSIVLTLSLGNHQAINCVACSSSLTMVSDAVAGSTETSELRGMDTCTGAGFVSGADGTFAFARTRFAFFLSCFGEGWTPAASHNSVKLNCKNVSKRRRSGAACEHPLKPK